MSNVNGFGAVLLELLTDLKILSLSPTPLSLSNPSSSVRSGDRPLRRQRPTKFPRRPSSDLPRVPRCHRPSSDLPDFSLTNASTERARLCREILRRSSSFLQLLKKTSTVHGTSKKSMINLSSVSEISDNNHDDETVERGGDPLILCFVDFVNPACAATALSALQGTRGQGQVLDHVGGGDDRDQV